MAGTVRPTSLQRPGGVGIASPAGSQTLSPAVPSTSTDFSSAVRKLVPPNKKQHELDLKDIADRVASKEREIAARKQQFSAGASASTERRTVLPNEIAAANERLRLASDAIKARNTEINKKHDEVNQLRSRMTYRSESQIDDTINKLEYKRTHHNFSLPEEQKIIREIDKLRRSKNELRTFNKLDGDRKALDQSLKELRDARQACFFGVQRLISEDKSLKDAERRHRDGLDEIGREIQELFNRKIQLIREHENRVAEWEVHVAANRRFKHVVEQQLRNNARNPEATAHELVVRDPYAGAKQVISSLLTYLQTHVKTEDNAVGGVGNALLPPPADVATQPVRASTPPPPPATPGDDDTPGYFLPKKHSDATTPNRGVHGRIKKDKKKTKPIAHSAAVVAQFTSLDLLPPANTSEVPTAIESLKAKKFDLDKKTVAALASLTPKISPTEEEIPSLPQPSTSTNKTLVSPSTDSSESSPPENVPSITVSATDEPDAVPQMAEMAMASPRDLSSSSVCDDTPQVDCEVTAACVMPNNEPKPSLTHSFTIDSVSEEDISAATSVGGESTAENSGDEEDKPISVTAPPATPDKPQPLLKVKLSSGDGRHLCPDTSIILATQFPETPPIDEAYTKPVFTSSDFEEET